MAVFTVDIYTAAVKCCLWPLNNLHSIFLNMGNKQMLLHRGLFWLLVFLSKKTLMELKTKKHLNWPDDISMNIIPASEGEKHNENLVLLCHLILNSFIKNTISNIMLTNLLSLSVFIFAYCLAFFLTCSRDKRGWLKEVLSPLAGVGCEAHMYKHTKTWCLFPWRQQVKFDKYCLFKKN